MKITREDQKTKFGDLLIGAVFEYDGCVFMKTRVHTGDIKVVSLADGRIWNLVDPASNVELDSVLVAPLDAELIVRGVLNEDTSR